MVIVKCGANHIDEVVSILDQEGVLDLDEQQAAWRSEGWQGAAGMTGVEPSDEMAHGRVRIQDRTTDRPAQE